MKRWFCLALALLTISCSTGPPPPTNTQFRSDDWPLAIEYGFSVAPTTAIPGNVDPAESAAMFTNVYFDQLLAVMLDTPLRSPHETLTKLEAAGGNSHARLRSLRRRLYNGEDLAPGELAAIYQDLQDRLLMVSWFEESAADGVQGVQVVDRGGHMPLKTEHDLIYAELEGQATGIVVDLWSGDILWRAVVHYSTDRLYVADDTSHTEVELTRAAAAVRLAGLAGEQ